MDGCGESSAATRSPTDRSSNASSVRISRRRGSAIALKMSDVVAARATRTNHIPILEYVKLGSAMKCQDEHRSGDVHHRRERLCRRCLRPAPVSSASPAMAAHIAVIIASSYAWIILECSDYW